jgi:hypothetical protein
LERKLLGGIQTILYRLPDVVWRIDYAARCMRLSRVRNVQSCEGFDGSGCSARRLSPLGFDSAWNCAERGVVLPSSQNSTSPSALKEPLLTRLPFSRIRSSIVTDLSENTCQPLDCTASSCVLSSYLEMIRNQMPVLAARTLDQDSSMMVSLFRQAMRRPCLADVACEGEFV